MWTQMRRQDPLPALPAACPTGAQQPLQVPTYLPVALRLGVRELADGDGAVLRAGGKGGVVAPVGVHHRRRVVRVLLALRARLGVPHDERAVHGACGGREERKRLVRALGPGGCGCGCGCMCVWGGVGVGVGGGLNVARSIQKCGNMPACSSTTKQRHHPAAPGNA